MKEETKEEADVLKKLLVEEKDGIRDLEGLVDKAREIFQIEKPTGRVLFRNFSKLSDPQRITALLLGKYFASKLALIESSSLRISEIAQELGRPNTALSGPLKALMVKGLVEKLPDSKYRIAYNRIRDIFGSVLKTGK